MNHIYYTTQACRLCRSKKIELALSLGLSPVSEKYISKEHFNKEELRVPLDLYFCRDCFHVQLIDIVESDYLWSDYTFRTSNNPALIEHFQDYASRVRKLANLEPEDLIVDVGSNDGTLLNCFRRQGQLNVLGIDPAEEIAQEAIASGVATLVGFMDDVMADRVLAEYGKAKLVTANNVYAHADDLSGMTRSIRSILVKSGLFTFEASYLLDIVDKNLIGTIFHEHMSYHSVLSLVKFLDWHGMELIHAERGPEQGGSILGYVQLKGGDRRPQSSVKALIELELERGLDRIDTFFNMAEQLQGLKEKVERIIGFFRNQGGVVAGFGAARAGTTLLSYFQIGKQIAFLVDDNQDKHYRFSPGDRLEVLPTSEIYRRQPDCIVILAWIHADKIIEKHKSYLDNGGCFVRVFPEFEVIKGERVSG